MGLNWEGLTAQQGPDPLRSPIAKAWEPLGLAGAKNLTEALGLRVLPSAADLHRPDFLRLENQGICLFPLLTFLLHLTFPKRDGVTNSAIETFVSNPVISWS
jgi:hypothetical protein